MRNQIAIYQNRLKVGDTDYGQTEILAGQYVSSMHTTWTDYRIGRLKKYVPRGADWIFTYDDNYMSDIFPVDEVADCCARLLGISGRIRFAARKTNVCINAATGDPVAIDDDGLNPRRLAPEAVKRILAYAKSQGHGPSPDALSNDAKLEAYARGYYEAGAVPPAVFSVKGSPE